VTCCSDVPQHRATGAVPWLFFPPLHSSFPLLPPGGALLDTEMQGIAGISFPNVTREGSGIEPSKPRGGYAASPTPRRSPSWLLLTRKEEGSCERVRARARTRERERRRSMSLQRGARIRPGETEFIRAAAG